MQVSSRSQGSLRNRRGDTRVFYAAAAASAAPRRRIAGHPILATCYQLNKKGYYRASWLAHRFGYRQYSGVCPMRIDIRRRLRKLSPHLLKAREDNLNEGDTLLRIIKVFEEALDYDPMSEITRESQVRHKYVDLAIKIDGVTRFLVEAKPAGTILRDRHIEQAQHYAAEANIPWAVLTNGVAWVLYHLSFDEGVEYVRAFAVDLASQPVEKVAECLGLLHRQSVSKGHLDKYWEHRVALSASSIARALFTDDTLRVVRREIRRREKVLIDPEDLANAIHEMLSTDAREQIGPLKIRRRSKRSSAQSVRKTRRRRVVDKPVIASALPA
jgi:predicted type IV restriction endonuclease